jgi:transcriptional regulator
VYIPEFNRVEDSAAINNFLSANPFAILVSTKDGVPFATHLPLLSKVHGDTLLLIGHVARANPHWTCMQEGRESLAIFHGPHAYVSPSLYEGRENVPTWNYAAVHVYGQAAVFSEDARLTEVLDEMIETYESAYMGQWRDLTQKYRDGMLRQIVGFEMRATRVEAKFKLSQNRTLNEQSRVMQSLMESETSAICDTGKMMESISRCPKK